jgi:hypothetical protein
MISLRECRTVDFDGRRRDRSAPMMRLPIAVSVGPSKAAYGLPLVTASTNNDPQSAWQPHQCSQPHRARQEIVRPIHLKFCRCVGLAGGACRRYVLWFVAFERSAFRRFSLVIRGDLGLFDSSAARKKDAGTVPKPRGILRSENLLSAVE